MPPLHYLHKKDGMALFSSFFEKKYSVSWAEALRVKIEITSAAINILVFILDEY